MKKILALAIGITKCIENLFQFFAVIALFYLLIFTLYTMCSLANSSAFDFFSSQAEIIMSVASFIWGGTKSDLFFIKEFLTGILLLAAIFFICQFVKLKLVNLGNFLKESLVNCYKSEEKSVNAELHRNIVRMNKKISSAVIYVEIKKKESVFTAVDLDEQYKLLNNFLYSKTNIIPEKQDGGFIYKFSNVEKIDMYLPFFFKAINSTAPIDYLFIFQIIENDFDSAMYEINKIKNSGIYNKILMTPATNLRYENIDNKSYSTGVVGNYVFAGESHSVYELKDKFFS